MEQLLSEIRISYADQEVNRLLASIPGDAQNTPYSMRFNQSEEYFVELGRPVVIPHFSIHHDVRQSVPSAVYIYALREVVSQLTNLLPDCFHGLTYFFDPAEILKPCFFRLYKVEGNTYLYLLRIDLLARPLEGEILERGDNDTTSAYSSTRLYMESELIPLSAVMWENGRIRAFRIRELISQTWIGETGRGYLVRGIWMDSDLTKFFTRLFMITGRRLYPFYPLYCKYKTICAMAPVLGSEGRRTMLPLLHRCIQFIQPELGQIQSAIKSTPFSESLPAFGTLRNRIPEAWRTALRPFRSEAYLNEREQKEYILHHETV